LNHRSRQVFFIGGPSAVGTVSVGPKADCVPERKKTLDLAQTGAASAVSFPLATQSCIGICSNSTMRRASRRFVAVMTLLGFLECRGHWPRTPAPGPSTNRVPDARDNLANASGPLRDHGKVQAGLCLEHLHKGKEASSSAAVGCARTCCPSLSCSATCCLGGNRGTAGRHPASIPQQLPPPLLLSQRLRIASSLSARIRWTARGFAFAIDNGGILFACCSSVRRAFAATRELVPRRGHCCCGGQLLCRNGSERPTRFVAAEELRFAESRSGS